MTDLPDLRNVFFDAEGRYAVTSRVTEYKDALVEPHPLWAQYARDSDHGAAMWFANIIGDVRQIYGAPTDWEPAWMRIQMGDGTNDLAVTLLTRRRR